MREVKTDSSRDRYQIQTGEREGARWCRRVGSLKRDLKPIIRKVLVFSQKEVKRR